VEDGNGSCPLKAIERCPAVGKGEAPTILNHLTDEMMIKDVEDFCTYDIRGVRAAKVGEEEGRAGARSGLYGT
jgi:hypothetical protein